MRHLKIFRQIPMTAMLCTAFGIAHAQSVESTDLKEPAFSDTAQWGLGIGVAASRSPYKGVSNRTNVLPLVLYESKYIHFFGNAVDLKLPSVENFTFTLRAKYALGDGYKASDSPTLSGMDERKGTIWLGGTAAWQNPYARLSLEALTAGNKGNTLKLGIEHAFQFGQFKLTPHAGATWMDSKYVDYYYGVKSNEVTATRSFYAGKSTTDFEVGVRADYALTKNQLILIDVGNSYNGSGITNSPLVDKSSSLKVLAGYLYKF
ncbi:MAG: outer membrane protein [Herbaspirillum sp.]|nr:outer membrane protein [Herbaspirillum sp.]